MEHNSSEQPNTSSVTTVIPHVDTRSGLSESERNTLNELMERVRWHETTSLEDCQAIDRVRRAAYNASIED